MTLTIQDVLNMFKNDEIIFSIAGNFEQDVIDQMAVKDFLIASLEDHEWMMKDAERYRRARKDQTDSEPCAVVSHGRPDHQGASISDLLINSACWHCNGQYPIEAAGCPHCCATNPNVDLKSATMECDDDSHIDHDWKFIDESFSHEFGTEIVHYWVCERCEKTRDEPAAWRCWDSEHEWWIYYESAQPSATPLFTRPQSDAARDAAKELRQQLAALEVRTANDMQIQIAQAAELEVKQEYILYLEETCIKALQKQLAEQSARLMAAIWALNEYYETDPDTEYYKKGISTTTRYGKRWLAAGVVITSAQELKGNSK